MAEARAQEELEEQLKSQNRGRRDEERHERRRRASIQTLEKTRSHFSTVCPSSTVTWFASVHGRTRPALLCAALICTFSSVVAPLPPKQVPSSFQVVISTNAEDGKTCPIVINVTTAWAEDSAARFWKMSTSNPPLYYDSAFYHVEPGHAVEFGISGDPQANHDFEKATSFELNDPQRYKNIKGTLSFVQVAGRANSTRLVINMDQNSDHDAEGFVPFAKVVSGMGSLPLIHAPKFGALSEWELTTKYSHLVVGVVEDEIEHLEAMSGLSGGATVAILLLALALLAALVLCLLCCYTEWRKRRLLRYSRELEDSGVEMVYDDEGAGLVSHF